MPERLQSTRFIAALAGWSSAWKSEESRDGVGRAAGVLEQQRVEERGAHVVAERELLGDPHPDRERADGVPGRLALGDVERVGERPEHLGERERGGLRAAHRSRASSSAAGSGRDRWKPWAKSQPSAVRRRELAGRLHALGHDPHPERLGHADDRLHDRGVALAVLAEVGDERAVDLERVDRVAAQVGQRRVAGAEVVEHQPHAEPPQRLQRLGDRGRVLEQQALGDLQRRAASGVEAGLAQHRADDVPACRSAPSGARTR